MFSEGREGGREGRGGVMCERKTERNGMCGGGDVVVMWWKGEYE